MAAHRPAPRNGAIFTSPFKGEAGRGMGSARSGDFQ